MTRFVRLFLSFCLPTFGLVPPAAAQRHRPACDPTTETVEVPSRSRPAVCGDGRATGSVLCTRSCSYGCGRARRCGPLECVPTGNQEACDGRDLAGETCVSQGYGGGRLRCTSECTLDASECRLCVPSSGLRCATLPLDGGQEVLLFARDQHVAVVSRNARGDIVGGFLDAQLTFTPFEPLATETRAMVQWGDRIAFVSREGHLRTVDAFTRQLHTVAEGMPPGRLTLLPETGGPGIAVVQSVRLVHDGVLLLERDGTPMSADRIAHFSWRASRLLVVPVREPAQRADAPGEMLRPGDRILAFGAPNSSHFYVLRGDRMLPLQASHQNFESRYTWNGDTLSVRRSSPFVDTYRSGGRTVIERSAPPSLRPAARGLGERAVARGLTIEALGGVLVVHRTGDPPSPLGAALVLPSARAR